MPLRLRPPRWSSGGLGSEGSKFGISSGQTGGLFAGLGDFFLRHFHEDFPEELLGGDLAALIGDHQPFERFDALGSFLGLAGEEHTEIGLGTGVALLGGFAKAGFCGHPIGRAHLPVSEDDAHGILGVGAPGIGGFF